MYVASRATAEPPMGGFGSFGVGQSEHDPFLEGDRQVEVGDDGSDGGSMSTTDTLAAALLECGTIALLPASMGGGTGPAADCAWEKLRSLVMSSPGGDIEAILERIATTPCSAVMADLGLPVAVSAAACGLSRNTWTAVQGLARDELISLRDGRTSREPRSAADGGGVIIRVEGEEPYVACQSDAEFGPTVFGAPGATGFRCPAGTGGVPGAAGTTSDTTKSTSPRFQAARPLVQATRMASGRVNGRVLGPDGSPVVGAEVRTGSLMNRPAGMTDATGAFSVSITATATQRLFISKDGYEGVTVGGIAVASGGTVDVGTIPMAAVGSPKTDGGSAGASGGTWYTSPWLIVGGLVVAGAAGYMIYRSRKG